MTRSQHEATRELERVEANWLRAYHWHETVGGWTHVRSPHPLVNLRDAVTLTRAAPLRFGYAPCE